MRCQEVSRQLAIYRQLGAAERQRVEEHLARCSQCAATWATYRLQDQLLSSLPDHTTLSLAEGVFARLTSQNHPAQRPASKWVSAASVGLLVLLLVLGGAMQVSAATLPGDLLYPLKRAVEEVQLTLTLNSDAHERYAERLAEMRRKEVDQVLKQRRITRVEFEGRLEETRGNVWTVDGLTVIVDSRAWSGRPPQPGDVIAIQGHTSDGQLSAERVDLRQTPPLLPTPLPSRGVAATNPATSPPSDTATPIPSATCTQTTETHQETAALPTRSAPHGQQPTATAEGRHPRASSTYEATNVPATPAMTPISTSPYPGPSLRPTHTRVWGHPSATPDNLPSPTGVIAPPAPGHTREATPIHTRQATPEHTPQATPEHTRQSTPKRTPEHTRWPTPERTAQATRERTRWSTPEHTRQPAPEITRPRPPTPAAPTWIQHSATLPASGEADLPY